MTSLLLAGSTAFAGTYKTINPKEAKAMIDKKKGKPFLLDVRTKEEYNGPAGHIKGAKLIPIGEIDSRLGEIEKQKEKDVIVYCAVGGRSSRVSRLLASKGFKKIYNMVGGMTEWNRLGYEVEKSD